MSVTKTMNTGVTGLRAQEQALNIVGDNIANVNTVGFKRSRAMFEDVLGSAAGARSTGSGTRFVRTQQIFTQGAIQNTGVPTDLALSGDGFFVVRGTVDGVDGQFFTRAGQTTFRDGTMVTPQGLDVMGYPALADGGFSSNLQPITMGAATLPPRATTEVELMANLDANEAPLATPFDINDPGATSNFASSVTVYDPQGNAQALDLYFVRTANPNEWEVHVAADATAVSNPAPANPTDSYVELASATITFDGDGKLQNLPAISANVTFDQSSAQTIDFSLGDPTSSGGTGMLGLTQYGSPSTVGTQSQDGYASGDLTAMDITTDGVVTGVYSNGEQIPMAQIAVAKFQANDGLARMGKNLWRETRDSGAPAIGGAAVGGRGAVISGGLEQSTVDLTSQFVDMITFQRAFSANSRTITTADEMLTEVVNLKR